ncbi:MAG TPA: MoxR family ATPase [Vicinamibacterales bacterium]|nr:MoxR family ATPase [Vicinamibacterales bacterium]
MDAPVQDKLVTMDSPEDIALADKMNAGRRRIEEELAKLIVGQQDVVNQVLLTLFVGGNSLIVGVPGLAKTLLIRTLAQVLDLKFNRIQFTPDLMPSDITGTDIIQEEPVSGARQMMFAPGPIFANIVLADEINRTTPRTQSALLEAMSDGQTSVDGHTHPLPQPFMVLATQNPFEFEGTYPLPESQLDRFLLRTSVGYPEREDELRVLTSHRRGEPVEELRPVVNPAQVSAMQAAARNVTVEDSIHEYLLDLVEATRRCEDLQVGVSTRGALGLYRAAQALAFVEGRDFVVPDDLKRLAVPVLAHRVIARGFGHGRQREYVENVIGRLLGEVAVPQ